MEILHSLGSFFELSYVFLQDFCKKVERFSCVLGYFRAYLFWKIYTKLKMCFQVSIKNFVATNASFFSQFIFKDLQTLHNSFLEIIPSLGSFLELPYGFLQDSCKKPAWIFSTYKMHLFMQNSCKESLIWAILTRFLKKSLEDYLGLSRFNTFADIGRQPLSKSCIYITKTTSSSTSQLKDDAKAYVNQLEGVVLRYLVQNYFCLTVFKTFWRIFWWSRKFVFQKNHLDISKVGIAFLLGVIKEATYILMFEKEHASEN